jgi:hypothetical protein
LTASCNFDLVRALNLRDHPNGVPSWPPEWIWADGLCNFYPHPEGEVGVLQDVQRSLIKPETCLFIRISYYGSVYLGRLAFDNQEFYMTVFELLSANYGHTIKEIGATDIPPF